MSTEQSQNINNILIAIRNSNRRSESVSLNLSSTLENIRNVLAENQLMNENDRFMNNNIPVNKKSEQNTTLGALLGIRRELIIGAPGSIGDLNDEVKYTLMTFEEKRFLLGEENINVYNGLTIEKGSADNVEFKRKFKKLYKFADDYEPSANNPIIPFKSKEFTAFTEDAHSMQCSGVNSTSISLTTPWITAEANFEHAKSKLQSSGHIKSYYTKRFTNNKVELSVDPAHIIVEDEFVNAFKNVMTAHERPMDCCYDLVSILNEYGWYIPLQYTLGGAIYTTKISEVSTLEDANKESIEFGIKAEVSFARFGGGASFKNNDSIESSSNRKESVERMTFYQIGGSVIGQDDIDQWENSLKNASNWNIICNTSLMPSLLLLRGKHNETLRNCLLLLRNHSYSKWIKELQPYINIGEYEFEIADRINPRYGY